MRPRPASLLAAAVLVAVPVGAGGRCTVEIGRRRVVCTIPRVSVSSAPLIGYGAPSPTSGDG
jgi:hypothetical protein